MKGWIGFMELKSSNADLKTRIWKYRWFYLMLLPVVALVILFYYMPMVGIRFAFYHYTPFKGPDWVGFENFQKVFVTPQFWTAFYNTLQISIFRLLLNTFIAVVLSLLMNEIGNLTVKKSVQTLIYLPHFLSWVVAASIFTIILSPQNGFVNQILINIGLIEKPIYFLADTKWWRPVFYIIAIWKETGWGTILYLATLSGINPELYEAAKIDGASRWNQIKFVTIPSLANTIIIVLILNLARIMNLFESVFVLYNPKVYEVADVVQTYVYRQTLATPVPNFGYTTAVGLFRSLISCGLVLICNYASKKVRGRGIV
jgi:putative aldouronate transport system permease protein